MTAKITFQCSGCGRPISVAEQHAGKVGKCPTCGQSIRVPNQQSEKSIDDASDAVLPAAERCINCGSEMSRGAVLCIQCGYDTRSGTQLKTQHAPVSGASSGKPVGIYRCTNGKKKPALLLDVELADPDTFPMICIFTGKPVNELRRMTIQDQDLKTAGGVVRTKTTNLRIALPVSEEAYEARVAKLARTRLLFFIASFLVVLIGSVGGVLAEYTFKIHNGTIAIPISMGGGLVLLVIAIMFPHLEDYFSDPNVVYGVRFGKEFTVPGIHEEFLKRLPSKDE